LIIFFKVEGGNFEKKEQRECAAGVTGTLLRNKKKKSIAMAMTFIFKGETERKKN